MMNLAIFLSEKTQTWIKVVLIVFLIVILVLALFGFIGMLIEKTMKWQACKVDEYMSNLVLSKTVNKPEDFRRIAKKKSYIVFFNQSIAPICLVIVGVIIWLIYHTVSKGNWSESILDYKTGILSLFYVPEWKSIKVTFATTKFIDISINWLNKPHFLKGGPICNYFIFLFIATGIIWWLVNIQAFVARAFRIRYLRRTLYSKDLSKMDLASFYNLDRVNPRKAKQNESSEEGK